MAKENNIIKNNIYGILVEPWITEAATASVKMNKYIFKIRRSTTKKQVKQVIEKLYKVKVLSVRTINVPGKTRTRGNIKGRKPGFKKAIVTLKEGDSINLYEGK